MLLKTASHAVATLTMGAALTLFAVTCSEPPTSPQPVGGQGGEQLTVTSSEQLVPGKVASVDYAQGTQPSGALYEIRVPDAWNYDVVVYAHGYVRPQGPLALPADEVDGTPVHEIITSMGYAYAATSYRRNGLVVPDAVEDLLELVEIFEGAYPAVNHVLLVGVSEGGLITTLAVEKHPDVFDGGLTACGPIGDFRRQLNYVGDFRVVFDYFFPGIIPGSPVDIPQQVIDNWESTYKPQVIAAIYASPHETEQLLAVTGAPIDEIDPSSVSNTVIGILEYNIFGTNDAIQQLGGQPFDNRWKFYRGSDNDWRLNRRVQRFRADLAALSEIAANYQTSGRLSVPLSAIHTTGDEIVPYWHEPLYRIKVFRNGSGLYHSNIPVFRYGHCNFAQAEVLAAFAVLVLKVTGADLLLAESVITSPHDRSQLLTISKDFGARPMIIPDDRLR